jgi:S-adenosylmethionine hydrolase
MAIISFITDFGIQDEYAGVMKAVILGIDPSAVLVDVTHAIDPQDVTQAAFMLESAYRHFPAGSIHVVVVDPEVGSRRAVLFLEAGGHRFLAPDNGVLSPVISRETPAILRRLENPALWLPRIAPTFHGRDLIAPVAAHLSKGGAADDIGPLLPVASIHRLGDFRARPDASGAVQGRVVHIDRFGNLVTNIDLSVMTPQGGAGPDRPLEVLAAGRVIAGVSRTYADVGIGRPLALIGSRGYLEIAVNGGSAQAHFGIRKGDAVGVRPRK